MSGLPIILLPLLFFPFPENALMIPNCYEGASLSHEELIWVEPDETGIIELLIQTEIQSNVSIRINHAPVENHMFHMNITSEWEDRVDEKTALLRPDNPTLLTFRHLNLKSIYSTVLLEFRTDSMKFENGTDSWHRAYAVFNQSIYTVPELPYPFTGLSTRLRCHRNWHSENCQNFCNEEVARKYGMVCDSKGSMRCQEGYCGFDCKKSGSKCPAYKKCDCENGSRCLLFHFFGKDFAYCDCPPNFFGFHCNSTDDRWKYFSNPSMRTSQIAFLNPKLNDTEWKANKFASRPDIAEIFDEMNGPYRHGHTNYYIFAVISAIFVFIVVFGVYYWKFKKSGKMNASESILNFANHMEMNKY